MIFCFFFSSRRRHTRSLRDWSSDVCSSDLYRIDLHTCGNCHSLNTLSLIRSFPRDIKTVVNKLMVTPEQASAIRNLAVSQRSEERRVGKECRSRWRAYNLRRKEECFKRLVD